MTADEIISYEIIYQMQNYLELNNTGTSNILPNLMQKVYTCEPLKSSEVMSICNVIGISMDSVAYGPICEPLFNEFFCRCDQVSQYRNVLVRRFHYYKLLCWRSKHLTAKELERFSKWCQFMDTPEGAYIWTRVKQGQSKLFSINRSSVRLHNKNVFMQFNTALGFSSNTNIGNLIKALKIINGYKKK